MLDTNLTPELIEEGFVREIISKIQTMRKDSGLEVLDNINITCGGSEKIAEIIKNNLDEISRALLAASIKFEDAEGAKEWNINGEKVGILIEKA